MISIVNKRLHTSTEYDHYIGRPNTLGNKYSHLDTSKYGTIKVATREKAVELYEQWLDEELKTNRKVKHEFEVLVAVYKATKKLNLVCWCAGKTPLTISDTPFRCHGQVLAKKIIDASKK